MHTFRNMPIKLKLMVIIMATTGFGLLLSGVGIIITDSILFRGYLERDLSALTRIIADNSTAALAFDDPRSASETLSALRARPHIVAACIYRQNGTTLATYSRPAGGRGQHGPGMNCPPPDARDEIQFTSAGLTVSRPILLKGRRIGTLTLAYDLDEIKSRRNLYGASILSILLASSLIASILSSKLRTLISTPILELVHAITAVSRTRDYSVRAQKFSSDESGVLVDAFNGMLAGIQLRDNRLKEALLAREQALKEAQNVRDSLHTTLASIGDAVISTDVQGRVAFANPVAQSLLRWPEAQVLGKHLDEVFLIVNEFSRQKVESPVSKVLREGAIVGLANHTILIARDGTETPIDDSGAPIFDETGKIQGTVLVFRDVTARRHADETTRLLASIVESSDDAIIGHRLDGTISSWNHGAARIFGYSMEEMIGRPASVIAEPSAGDEMPAVLERIRRGERIEQYQAIRRTKSGSVIDVSITVSPLYDALGKIVGASKIARDISQQVLAARRLAQLYADLQRANEDLARSNEDLERFAFVASHDLQDPLRMITVYSQLLVKSYPPQLDNQATAFVNNIVGGTKRMRELLADLLAYTEIGARSEAPVEVLDLNEVVGKALQNLRASIEDAGAEVTAGQLPSLSGYEAHFISLFQNLIGNAIKYRSDQPPRINISVEELTDQLRFAVTDNGIGIDPEYHQTIFVAFKRLHGNKIPGTGIGLAICQRVVERYGGRIWVESQVGQGAAFLFTLPAHLMRPPKNSPGGKLIEEWTQ